MRKARKSKIHPLSHARKQRINPAIATAIIIPRRLNCMRDRVSIRQAVAHSVRSPSQLTRREIPVKFSVPDSIER